MHWKKPAVLLVFLLLAAVSVSISVAAFNGTGGIYDDSGTTTPPDCPGDPECTSGTETNPSDVSPGNCTDGSNNDLFRGADDGDSASCVQPYFADDNEASIWDSDLTTVMSGESPSDGQAESIFFAGEVHLGNDKSDTVESDSSSSGDDRVTEFYIQDLKDESSGYYAYGFNQSTDISGFPTGTQFESGRIIDAPNNDAEQCGDGIRNGGEGTSTPGDEGGTSSEDTGCRIDRGRVKEKYDVKTRAEGSSQSGSTETSNNGYWCRDDDEDSSGGSLSYSCSDGSDASCTYGDGSYPGCSTGSCDSTGEDGKCTERTGDDSTGSETSSADGTWNDYWSGDESTHYWYKDGQNLRKDTCSDTGGWSQTGNGGSSCDYLTQSYNDSFSCNTDTGTCSGGSDTTIKGDNRDWTEETSSSIDCNDRNLVDGGGDTSNDIGGGYPNKADNDPAGTFTDFTAYQDLDWGSSGKVWCGFDTTLTVDADGPKGYGDGFVVIDDGSIAATWGPTGADTVGQRVMVDGSTSSFEDHTDEIDASCPSGFDTCLKYVDYMTVKGSGSTSGSPAWTTVDGAVTVNEDNTETYTADESYSVCKKINQINEQNGDGDELIDCDYERGSAGSEDVSPLPEACGDETDEHLILMEGPAVDNSVARNYLAYEQKCVDWGEDSATVSMSNTLDEHACVRKGQAYAEGTVIEVEIQEVTDSFEAGTVSPDWEVCLDLDKDGDSTGDEKDWDNEGNSGDDYGGEWYDLDDERVNDYIEGNSLATGSGSSNNNDVAFYYRENPNPSHSTYNPGGDRGGLALEDDCDPDLAGCDESTSSNNLFYTPAPDDVSQGPGNIVRDEDYHPQSNDDSSEGPLYQGKVKKLYENSNQLEDSMDTIFPSNRYDTWTDSDGSEDSADQYAYVDDLREAIDNRGKTWEPGGTYFRPGASSSPRTSPDDDSVPKEDKVFGNSIVVVSTGTGATTAWGEDIPAGEGYWMEPDELRARNTHFQTNWVDLLKFNIDLTGPDSGLGYNASPSSGIGYDYQHPDSPKNWVTRGNIYFERDSGGDISGYLETPMCGDDQREYLIEEGGESKRSAQFDGRFACVDSPTDCYTFADGKPTVVSEGVYMNAHEPDEDVGRLKNDKEICIREDPMATQAKFYDQDYGDIDGDGEQETCRDNTLYGLAGTRWIDSDYVEDHPWAVRGGIDDDWNAWLKQEWERGQRSNYTYEPNPTAGPYSWGSEDSPVPTGSPNESIATLGFCGGDDADEYLVTQECSTRLCETDNSVLGVADDPGECVLDGSRYPVQDPANDRRKLYDTGDNVTFDLGNSQRSVACYRGTWYEKWPIVFEEDRVNVGSGQTKRTTFYVINVDSVERTFEVEIQDSDVAQFSEFSTKEGDSFTTTVPAQSSKQYQMDIYGGDTTIDNSPLRLQADAVNSRVSGEDSVNVDITDASTSSAERSETENVPGIGIIHILFLLTISTLMFYSQS